VRRSSVAHDHGGEAPVLEPPNVSRALEASAAAAFPITPPWVASNDLARPRPYAKKMRRS
jgi:hypothetical protein